MNRNFCTFVFIWVMLWITYLCCNIVAVAWDIHKECKNINSRIDYMGSRIDNLVYNIKGK